MKGPWWEGGREIQVKSYLLRNSQIPELLWCQRRMKTKERRNRNDYICQKWACTAEKGNNPVPRGLTQNALSHDGLITIGTTQNHDVFRRADLWKHKAHIHSNEETIVPWHSYFTDRKAKELCCPVLTPKCSFPSFNRLWAQRKSSLAGWTIR